MNWGKKILILYLGFVGLILTLVFTCFGHKTELEYKDYYARELQFQDQINAQQNNMNLKAPISHQVNGMELELFIPEELTQSDYSGSIHLMRPSNSEQDITLPIDPNAAGTQLVRMQQSGNYKMRVTLKSGGKTYYHESVLRFK